jgi:hypothetical protein
MDTYELTFVPNFKYSFQFSSTERAYLCPDGLHVLQYRLKNGQTTCFHLRVYIWVQFKIEFYYYEKKSQRKGTVQRFSFTLDNIFYPDRVWNDMLEIIQDRTLIVPSKRNLIVELLNQYIRLEDIPEKHIADIVGYTENGWQLPPEFYFVAGNEFREKIEEDIRASLEKAPPSRDRAVQKMKEIFEITSMDHKDYIFAYGIVAVFLFALRRVTKLLPLLALGGAGGKGKTAIEEFFTCVFWGNIPGIVGSAIMETEARVQGYLTGSTMPVCIDDCQDLKDFVTSIFKRYTTVSETVKKLNPDQSTKMDCQYCSPVMMTFNNYPVLFNDPAFRQRIIVLIINEIKQNDKWNEVCNSIEKGELGRYVIAATKEMKFADLVSLYQKMDSMDMKEGRGKTIARLMNLGKYFAKELFDLDLDLSKLPFIIQDSLKMGNEEMIDLIRTQIRQSQQFKINKEDVLENPNRRSWVIAPVEYVERKFKDSRNLIKGFMYTTDNAFDLARQMNKTVKEVNLKNVSLILETEWKTIRYDTFYTKSGTIRAIFIPLSELILPDDPNKTITINGEDNGTGFISTTTMSDKTIEDLEKSEVIPKNTYRRRDK